MPQGNLAERMRAAGAGIGAFFTPDRRRHAARRGQGSRARSTAATTCSSTRSAPTVALIKAHRGRRGGQPRLPQDRPQLRAGHGDRRDHRPSSRSREIVPAGALDPEAVVTPGIFVDRLVACASAARRPRRAGDAHGGAPRPRAAGPATRWPRLRRRATSPPGAYVNLGIGLPTTVADYLPAEQRRHRCTPRTACSAWARAAEGDEVDPDLINAGKIPVTETAGRVVLPPRRLVRA